jgi:hypothetical protein
MTVSSYGECNKRRAVEGSTKIVHGHRAAHQLSAVFALMTVRTILTCCYLMIIRLAWLVLNV